jgi:F1F0 ATPase subunit 2
MINSIASNSVHIVDLTSLLSAVAAGMFLGCIFFYVLWLSAQKVLDSRQPVLWFVTSWLSRMTIAVYGLYWVGSGNLQMLLACLSGFMVGRWMISRIIMDKKPSHESRLKSSKIVENAP